MKIAVFENEYDSVKGAFNASNLLNFDSKLTIVNYPSSQVAKIQEVIAFDVIFVDIDLSSKSLMDGYSLIELLISTDPTTKDKIIILTGNNKIKENLIQKSIEISDSKIILKPTNYEEITNAINACT